MDHVERIGRKLVFKGSVLDIYQDDIRTPNGKVVKWDFIGHIGAAAVVAVRDNGKLIMVKQYRNALDRMTIEIPAGKRDYEGEPTINCAIRELQEETGCTAEKMEYLMTLRTAIAYCDELIDVYVATGLTQGEQHLDEDECVELLEFDVEELCRMIYAGELQDVKTIAAIMAYKNKYLIHD
ncbi:MAG: NUDIX hydrolase [Lachnospiraceae bacterium]|nr:NUDIX hydrolase [Lachnospiraceae bacterium]